MYRHELTFFGVGGERGGGVANCSICSVLSVRRPAGEQHLPILSLEVVGPDIESIWWSMERAWLEP